MRVKAASECVQTEKQGSESQKEELQRELERVKQEHAAELMHITQMFSVSSLCQVGPWARRGQSAQVTVNSLLSLLSMYNAPCHECW